jgi:hypothetical protein
MRTKQITDTQKGVDSVSSAEISQQPQGSQVFRMIVDGILTEQSAAKLKKLVTLIFVESGGGAPRFQEMDFITSVRVIPTFAGRPFSQGIKL